MGLHPWWSTFELAVSNFDDLTSEAAKKFAKTVSAGILPGVSLIGIKRRENDSNEAILLDLDVERPQHLACDIKAIEPIAIIFRGEGEQPSVLALRENFPDTPHQNWTPVDAPCSLCVDDRPWLEGKLTFTPAELIRKTQLWLAKAARGELHDWAQPLDPLFFRNPVGMVVPFAMLNDNSKVIELVGFQAHSDNPNIVIMHQIKGGTASSSLPSVICLTFKAMPQAMSRLRHAPNTLAALAGELEKSKIDLLNAIREHIKDWANLQNDNLRKILTRLAIIVSFPVISADGKVEEDFRAFITSDIAGEVGVKLGIVQNNVSGIGLKEAYLPIIAPKTEALGDNIQILAAEVYSTFNRELAAAVAGDKKVDCRKVILVGAGSVGSQIATNLVREGNLSWTIVDKDFVLPHNLARHILFAPDVGVPKAHAVANQLQMILGEPVDYLICDVTNPAEDKKHALNTKFSEAEIIIDASASVAVSRHIADMPDIKARQISTFFNPAGNSVVLLSTGVNCNISLHDLEAQYHGILLSEPHLADHLKVEQPGLRYSGSCRSLTNRIPASRAALLSAIAARGIRDALDRDVAKIYIWTVSDDGSVNLHKQAAASVKRITLGNWMIIYNESVLKKLSQYREQQLPNETGGVLLGIVDVSRRSIHIAHALSQPPDSRGSRKAFERGVVGLRAAVTNAVEESMHHLRYVGEWHSHPRGSSAHPSITDLHQLIWLGEELENEGVPAIVAIAADNGSFSFMLANNVDTTENMQTELAPKKVLGKSKNRRKN